MVHGGMADAAGARAGDVIASIDGRQIYSLCALGAALRAAGARRAAELVVEQRGEQIRAQVAVRHMPRETLAGQTVSYESLDAAGARLRSIVTHPDAAPPRGAVLCVQGIACESIELAGRDHAPLAGLAHGWARAGFVTMRVDKRGVGDSEGGPCHGVDFDTERADFRAAMAAFCADPRTQSVPLFLFGHSVGGMLAPLLAPPRAFAGVMTYGTSTSNWLDCVEQSTSRQLALRGKTPSDIDAHIATLRQRVARDGLNGRSAAYHRQLDRIDLRSAWQQAPYSRLLVLRGEYDWVVGAEEQAELAAVVGDRVEGAARVVDLPGLDHMLGWHEDRAASLSEYGAGRADGQVLKTSLEWMHTQAVDSGP